MDQPQITVVKLSIPDLYIIDNNVTALTVGEADIYPEPAGLLEADMLVKYPAGAGVIALEVDTALHTYVTVVVDCLSQAMEGELRGPVAVEIVFILIYTYLTGSSRISEGSKGIRYTVIRVSILAVIE